MHIERTRQIDASETDEAGVSGYRYEYDLYRFTEGGRGLVARSYVHDPEEAHFLRAEAGDRPRTLVDADLKHPLFLAASDYLRASGKRRLNWLSGRGNGYEPVPFETSGTPGRLRTWWQAMVRLRK